MVKWASSNSKTPTIIISNYNTKDVLVNTKLECRHFEYKGVSKNGKSLLFNCVNMEEFLKDPKNKEDFINWLVSLVYKGTYIIIEPCYSKDKDCQETKTIEKEYSIYIDNYLEYHKDMLEIDDIEIKKPNVKISKNKVKSVLEKNIYYINNKANYNVIHKEYSAFLEKKNELDTKINEIQENINNLNTQITELAEVNRTSEDLQAVNNFLRGKYISQYETTDYKDKEGFSHRNMCYDDTFDSIFFPSMCDKYTGGTKFLLFPVTLVSFAVAIVTLPIWVWFT